MSLGVKTDLPRFICLSILPEQQVTHRETPVHGIEEVTHLNVGPHERPLDIWETDVTDVDIVQKCREVIVYSFETRLQFVHYSPFFENCSTPFTLVFQLGPRFTAQPKDSSQARAAGSAVDSVKALLAIQPGPAGSLETLRLPLHEFEFVSPTIQHFEEAHLMTG